MINVEHPDRGKPDQARRPQLATTSVVDPTGDVAIRHLVSVTGDLPPAYALRTDAGWAEVPCANNGVPGGYQEAPCAPAGARDHDWTGKRHE